MAPRYKSDEQDKVRQTAMARLLAAAAEAISRQGYSKANINHISLAAGFARGTIYNYFDSKEALMQALLEQAAADHLEALRMEVLSAGQPQERLRTFFTAGFAYIEDNLAPMLCVLHTLYGPHRPFRELTWQIYQPMFLFLAFEILKPGMDSGTFHQGDPIQTANMVLSLYLGAASHPDDEGHHMLDAQRVADFALRALLP